RVAVGLACLAARAKSRPAVEPVAVASAEPPAATPVHMPRVEVEMRQTPEPLAPSGAGLLVASDLGAVELPEPVLPPPPPAPVPKVVVKSRKAHTDEDLRKQLIYVMEMKLDQPNQPKTSSVIVNMATMSSPTAHFTPNLLMQRSE